MSDEKIELVLLSDHQHGGVLLTAGTRLTVPLGTGAWLVENGIAVKAVLVATKTGAEVVPAKGRGGIK